MTRRLQPRHWAILGAAALVAGLVAANLHLVVVAVASQPECLPVAEGLAPARARC